MMRPPVEMAAMIRSPAEIAAANRVRDAEAEAGELVAFIATAATALESYRGRSVLVRLPGCMDAPIYLTNAPSGFLGRCSVRDLDGFLEAVGAAFGPAGWVVGVHPGPRRWERGMVLGAPQAVRFTAVGDEAEVKPAADPALVVDDWPAPGPEPGLVPAGGRRWWAVAAAAFGWVFR
jgi:hypothetical protein